MVIYNQERGSGKSTRLLIISDVTGIPIVVPKKENVEYLEFLKKKHNCPNAIIFTWNEFINKHLTNKEILIDEGSHFFDFLLKHEFGVTVKAVADTIPFKEDI